MSDDLLSAEKKLAEAKATLRGAKIEDELAQRELKQRQTAFLEGAKLNHDSFETQATLSTGSIIAISAIVQGLLPPEPAHLFLLWITYGALLVSMIASIAAMGIIVSNVHQLPDLYKRTPAQKRAQSVSWWTYGLISIGGFFGGIISFLIFAALNLLG